MSVFHFEAVNNVCRLCSSKILKQQSVDIIPYITKIKLWYDFDIDNEISNSPDIIPFFPTVLCKSCVSALHKLEVGTRKSKPTGVLLDTSPVWITRQHNFDNCIVCKIYKGQKGIKRKAQNPSINPVPLSPYNPNNWERPTPMKCRKCLSVKKSIFVLNETQCKTLLVH